MTPLKFDILAMIRDPDDYTSNERAAGAVAVAELIEAAKACEKTELGEMACVGSMAPCEDALGQLFAALDTIRSAS